MFDLAVCILRLLVEVPMYLQHRSV